MGEWLRTIDALVALAASAKTPEEAEQRLDEAGAQATTFGHWQAITEALYGLPAIPERARRALVARARRSAEENREIWGFRHVAEAEVFCFDDEAAAWGTLRAGERMLLEDAGEGGSALGYEWGVLARAYRDVFRDEASARRCLEAGWRLAWSRRDVEQLGRLANAWGDREEGRARLAAVEEASVAWGTLGGLVHWWHALEAPERAVGVRQQVLETTTRFDEALDLVRYWKLYDKESPGIEEALARAEALATTADELFELARQGHVDRAGDGVARRALDRAATLPMTSETRARVASALAAWFKDEAAADRVGPRGVRPEAHRPCARTLPGWGASASSLFDRLRGGIAPESLRRIAEADYGDDVDRHLGALARLVESGLVPLELGWHPGEVVELTRWSTGPDVDHVARALSCTLLMLTSNESSLLHDAAILVESCLALGGDVPLRGEELLAWCYETQPDEGEACAALLCLFVLRAARDAGDDRLPALLRLLGAKDGARGLREATAECLRADLWSSLLEGVVAPLFRAEPGLVPLLAAIGFGP